MSKINIAIIGLGYWGPNYVRIASQSPSVNLKWCCDLKSENLEKIKQSYPVVKTTENYQEILADQEVEAVIISTPTATHYQIAKDCLLANKNVLVEKPLDYIAKRAKELAELAQAKDKILMVGHIFKFNPAIQKIKEYIDRGDLGEIYYLSFDQPVWGQSDKILMSCGIWDPMIFLFFSI